MGKCSVMEIRGMSMFIYLGRGGCGSVGCCCVGVVVLGLFVFVGEVSFVDF